MAYKVKRQFTDSTGKTWKTGQPFEASEEEIEKQEQAGNIEQVVPGAAASSEQGGAPA